MAMHELHSDFEYIISSGGIDEFKFKKNGLGVLLMEDTSAPGTLLCYEIVRDNKAIYWRL
jgi:hypothetical protein